MRSFDEIVADHLENAANMVSGLILDEIGEDGHVMANHLWKIVTYLRNRERT